MFEAALQRLVAEAGAELAIFCDYEGESIALAVQRLDPFEVRVLGAQHAAVVLQLQRIARESGQGERLSFQLRTDARVLLVEALPGGYYVLLGMAPHELWPRAVPALRRLADRFAAEI